MRLLIVDSQELLLPAPMKVVVVSQRIINISHFLNIRMRAMMQEDHKIEIPMLWLLFCPVFSFHQNDQEGLSGWFLVNVSSKFSENGQDH